MRILEINSVCGIRSTGRIASEIAEKYINEGDQCIVASGRETVPEKCAGYSVRIGGSFDVYSHFALSAVFDSHGFGSKRATKKFLKWADEYDPDMLWLHNIHGYYINIEMLFDWIKKRPDMKVRWTLHDCWAFTGHCTYFSYAGCDKWKTGCGNCPQKKEYPVSFIEDRSSRNFERKKKAFTGVKNMTLITPSKWLAALVKESFLKEYPVEVINNEIDKTVFKPTESDFKERFGIENKKMILGVASIWSRRKGLDDFIKLAGMLDDKYKIVIVGLTEKQMEKMPVGILCITRTNSAKELAGLYTAADVFVNPTYEDNYPTVNLEAKSCGTPVITYDTGGSVESVEPGMIVGQGDVEALKRKIEEIVG